MFWPIRSRFLKLDFFYFDTVFPIYLVSFSQFLKNNFFSEIHPFFDLDLPHFNDVSPSNIFVQSFPFFSVRSFGFCPFWVLIRLSSRLLRKLQIKLCAGSFYCTTLNEKLVVIYNSYISHHLQSKIQLYVNVFFRNHYIKWLNFMIIIQVTNKLFIVPYSRRNLARY